ncbi:MAG: tagaturonate reductase [Firmicutes bacterium]|jgi:tagaturonate reductase|nr:tagaturonate reductase [Bacillota bacterium]HPU01214.1 tagaturonate reductase [Bacillota bacterium]
MQQLNAELLKSNFSFPADLKTPSSFGRLPEKVIQFGEGNFLRAFVDWMFHRLNEKGLFNGRVVVIQPIAEGLVPVLNEQDGLYTLILRGLQEGKPVETMEIISSVSRGINPYTDWEEYLRCAENPDIEFVVSNTTEAGIAYDPGDSLEKKPPRSFPGKLLAFLYHRFQHFGGDRGRGLVMIPCELIDRNGEQLQRVLLQLAGDWKLPREFVSWLKEANYFLNTLVDRVVTGYPREEIDALTQRLGYRDRLLDTGELFHLWVIEGPPEMKARLPFTEAGLNVIWTDDLSPYRTRKVRILNGAHTASVPAAFLYGLETVGEMMSHPLLGEYTRKVVYEEIIPSIDLEEEMLRDFAGAVLERFQNPFIKHYLLDILLNSVSKYTTRVLPSLEGYFKRKGQLPPVICFSLAALLALYRGRVEGGVMHSRREKGDFVLRDDPQALSFLGALWAGCDNSPESLRQLVEKALGSELLWGRDLNEIPGLADRVAACLEKVVHQGMKEAVAWIVRGE